MNQSLGLRPIWLSVAGVIDQALVNRLLQTFAGLMRDGFDDVHLMIQSNGGYMNDCVAISNFLSVAPMPITTYNMGHVGSAAVPVYLAGRKRVAAANATFMIHSPFLEKTGGSAAAITAAGESLRVDEERMQWMLRAALSLPDEKWRMYEAHDVTLTSQDFVLYGGTHEVGTFSPPTGSPFFNV